MFQKILSAISRPLHGFSLNKWNFVNFDLNALKGAFVTWLQIKFGWNYKIKDIWLPIITKTSLFCPKLPAKFLFKICMFYPTLKTPGDYNFQIKSVLGRFLLCVNEMNSSCPKSKRIVLQNGIWKSPGDNVLSPRP